uniref:Uncharacterized protein n=1 Tax=Ascaris lumbricoides TaxID=6252 RepID=A0A0M3I6A2_ASCLU
MNSVLISGYISLQHSTTEFYKLHHTANYILINELS